MRVLKIVIVWILPGVVGLLFIVVAVGKFADPSWRANFARWGYPAHFYAVTGLIEAAGGFGLFVPRLRVAAAIMLAAVMVAATLTAVVHGEPRFARVALVYLLLVVTIAWTQRKFRL